jgi:hypothetical protein
MRLGRIYMKFRVISLLIVTFFIVELSLAQNKVVLTNKSGSQGHVEFRDGSKYTEGQTLYLAQGGKPISRIKIVQMSAQKTKALVHLVSGSPLKTGAGVFTSQELAMMQSKDRAPAARPGSVRRSRGVAYDHDWSAEDPYFTEAKVAPAYSPAFGTIMIGYDMAFMSEHVEGGFAFGVSGGYRFTEEWALGLSIQRTSGMLTGSVNTSFGTYRLNQDYSAVYLMPEALYFLSPEFFIGGTIGAVFFDTAGTEFDDTYFAIGGLVGYNYFFNEMLSLTGRANLRYVMLNSEFIDDPLMFNIMAGVSYWF